MTRPSLICGEPGCDELDPCPKHGRLAKMREYNRGRDEASRFYSTAKWRGRSAAFLAAHPVCEGCGAKATEADHQPDRRVLLEMGVGDPDADEYLHPLCHICHSRKSMIQKNERRRKAWTPHRG